MDRQALLLMCEDTLPETTNDLIETQYLKRFFSPQKMNDYSSISFSLLWIEREKGSVVPFGKGPSQPNATSSRMILGRQKWHIEMADRNCRHISAKSHQTEDDAAVAELPSLTFQASSISPDASQRLVLE